MCDFNRNYRTPNTCHFVLYSLEKPDYYSSRFYYCNPYKVKSND